MIRRSRFSRQPRRVQHAELLSLLSLLEARCQLRLRLLRQQRIVVLLGLVVPARNIGQRLLGNRRHIQPGLILADPPLQLPRLPCSLRSFSTSCPISDFCLSRLRSASSVFPSWRFDPSARSRQDSCPYTANVRSQAASAGFSTPCPAPAASLLNPHFPDRFALIHIVERSIPGTASAAGRGRAPAGRSPVGSELLAKFARCSRVGQAAPPYAAL